MAKFDIEFDKVVLAEGGYVNDKDDNCGETYLGISRKFNPNWKGWTIVDQVKKQYKSIKDINVVSVCLKFSLFSVIFSVCSILK